MWRHDFCFSTPWSLAPSSQGLWAPVHALAFGPGGKAGEMLGDAKTSMWCVQKWSLSVYPQNGNFWEGKPWSPTTGWLTETLRKQKEWIWPWINTHKYRFLKGVAIHKSLFSAILIFAKIVCSRAAVSGAQVFDRHLLGSSLRVKVTSCCKAKEFEHGLLYAPMHGKCDEF